MIQRYFSEKTIRNIIKGKRGMVRSAEEYSKRTPGQELGKPSEDGEKIRRG